MNRNQMPPLGSYEVDTAAVKVMEEWILGMPSRAIPSGLVRGSNGSNFGLSPILRGRELILPPGLLAGNPAVRLRGLDGRIHPLTRAGNDRYAVPASVPRGVYILQVGSRTFTRSVW